MDIQLKVKKIQTDFGSLTRDCKSSFLKVVYFQVNMSMNPFHTTIKFPLNLIMQAQVKQKKNIAVINLISTFLFYITHFCGFSIY